MLLRDGLVDLAGVMVIDVREDGGNVGEDGGEGVGIVVRDEDGVRVGGDSRAF